MTKTVEHCNRSHITESLVSLRMSAHQPSTSRCGRTKVHGSNRYKIHRGECDSGKPKLSSARLPNIVTALGNRNLTRSDFPRFKCDSGQPTKLDSVRLSEICERQRPITTELHSVRFPEDFLRCAKDNQPRLIYDKDINRG